MGQVEAAQHGALLDKVREQLGDKDLSKYVSYVEALAVGDVTISDVACALFKMVAPQNAPASQEINFSEGRGDSDRRWEDKGDGPRGGKGKPRAPRESFHEGPMEKIFLNIGRVQGILPKAILGALAGETGLPGNIFGNIEIQAKGTIVEVAAEHVQQVIGKFQNVRMKGLKVRSRLARE
jgi:ATP-dependent RNA helicase DeaD